jgi:hypothetical protein
MIWSGAQTTRTSINYITIPSEGGESARHVYPVPAGRRAPAVELGCASVAWCNMPAYSRAWCVHGPERARFASLNTRFLVLCFKKRKKKTSDELSVSHTAEARLHAPTSSKGQKQNRLAVNKLSKGRTLAGARATTEGSPSTAAVRQAFLPCIALAP